MTSIDQSELQFHHQRMIASSPRASVLDNGGRLLLLAVGGFVLMRVALAILQFS